MARKILLATLIIVLIGVCTGIYQWNRKAAKAEDTEGVSITAAAITRQYAADEKKADTAYLDKVLEVSGKVSDVAANQDGATVVTLGADDPMAGVLCTMRERTVHLAKGKRVVIKGFCRGNNMGVVLTDCIVK